MFVFYSTEGAKEPVSHSLGVGIQKIWYGNMAFSICQPQSFVSMTKSNRYFLRVNRFSVVRDGFSSYSFRSEYHLTLLIAFGFIFYF